MVSEHHMPKRSGQQHRLWSSTVSSDILFSFFNSFCPLFSYIIYILNIISPFPLKRLQGNKRNTSREQIHISSSPPPCITFKVCDIIIVYFVQPLIKVNLIQYTIFEPKEFLFSCRVWYVGGLYIYIILVEHSRHWISHRRNDRVEIWKQWRSLMLELTGTKICNPDQHDVITHPKFTRW